MMIVRMLLIGLFLPLMSGAQYLPSQASGRATGLASSTLTLSDAWSPWQNVATTAFIENPLAGFGLSQRYFLPELALFQSSYLQPSSLGVFNLAARYFGFEDYNQSTLGLGYARQFSPYYSFGLQLNYHHLHIAESSHSSPSSITFDVGMLAKATDQLHFALSISNPSYFYLNEQTQERHPLVWSLGSSYLFSEHFLLCGSLEKQLGKNERYGLGAEYLPLDLLSLRAGMRFQPHSSHFGIGLNYHLLHFDLGYEYAGPLGNNAAASFQFDF